MTELQNAIKVIETYIKQEFDAGRGRIKYDALHVGEDIMYIKDQHGCTIYMRSSLEIEYKDKVKLIKKLEEDIKELEEKLKSLK